MKDKNFQVKEKMKIGDAVVKVVAKTITGDTFDKGQIYVNGELCGNFEKPLKKNDIKMIAEKYLSLPREKRKGFDLNSI